jgi:DNA polymerase V
MGKEQSSSGVSVHAGFPNPATDQSLHTLDFNQLLIQHSASTYMFRIAGNEWEGVGIFDGDIAIVDRALQPRKDDVVVWLHDAMGEFSLTHYSARPSEGSCWGIVTATIHQLRKTAQQ